MGKREQAKKKLNRLFDSLGLWPGQTLLESILVLILALFPLRHIHLGLDLWDTGYSLSNFMYMGTDHMDPMWLFSTYLANVTGHLLTLLPNGTTLVGMNLYTGLFISLMGVGAYLFATRGLKVPKLLAFGGELLALCLCWCPSAVLYNYLTYFFLGAAMILIYLGLSKKNNILLAVAGACLGLNVFVRFSNLPEAVLILAVWAYGTWECNDQRKEGAPRRRSARQGYRWTAIRTLYCIAGYFIAVTAMIAVLSIFYGLDAYVEGIKRLFSMSGSASGYSIKEMLVGMVFPYIKNLYWLIRLLIFAAAATFLCMLGRFIDSRNQKPVFQGKGKWPFENGISAFGFAKILSILIGIGSLVWLWLREFCSTYYFSYDSMLRPCTVFMMIGFFICWHIMLMKERDAQDKLYAALCFLIMVITSFGSNNNIYPSLNNLFLILPYFAGKLWKYCREQNEVNEIVKKASGSEASSQAAAGSGMALPTGIAAAQESVFGKDSKEVLQKKENEKSTSHAVSDSKFKIFVMRIGNVFHKFWSPFGLKACVLSFLALFVIQVFLFGVVFNFQEATGSTSYSGKVTNNKTLSGVRMSSERALWMTELSNYVNREGLEGQELLTYGYLPSLPFYLKMPAAFNPWCDLASYSASVMLSELEGLKQEDCRPVIILENDYALYLEKQAGVTTSLTEGAVLGMEADAKWHLFMEYMEELGYEQTFRNEKFAVYR